LVLGQQMVAEVVTCKDQLASGQHGIGDCVSSFVQAQHEPSSSMRTGSATTTPLASGAPEAKLKMSLPPAPMPSAASDSVVMAYPSAPAAEHGQAVSAVAQTNAAVATAGPGSEAQAARSGDTHGSEVSAVAKPSAAPSAARPSTAAKPSPVPSAAPQ